MLRERLRTLLDILTPMGYDLLDHGTFSQVSVIPLAPKGLPFNLNRMSDYSTLPRVLCCVSVVDTRYHNQERFLSDTSRFAVMYIRGLFTGQQRQTRHLSKLPCFTPSSASSFSLLSKHDTINTIICLNCLDLLSVPCVSCIRCQPRKPKANTTYV